MSRARLSKGLALLAVVVAALLAAGCQADSVAPGDQDSTATPLAAATEGTATATAPPATPTLASPPVTIVLDTPPPGIQVGSPVLITGRTSALPPDGALGYSVRDGAGAEIGGGTFPVTPDSATGGGVFSAPLSFREPAAGGAISLLVFQLGPDGNAYGQVGISLMVAPQAIWIDSPPPATLVGSPVVIAGRTAHIPASGSLTYRFVDAGGAPLGSGSIPLSPGAGGGGSFNASLEFSLPPAGGAIQVELLDRDPATGVVYARAGLSLVVTAPPAPAPTLIVLGDTSTPTAVPVGPTLTYTPVTPSPTFTPSPTPTLSGVPVGPTLTYTPVTPSPTYTPVTPSPTYTPVTPSPTLTATPCVGFSCPALGTLVAYLPGNPNFSYTPCAKGPATPHISLWTEGLSEDDTSTPRDPYVGQRLYYFACNFSDPASLRAELSGPGGTQTPSILPPNSPLLDDVKKKYANGVGAAQGAVLWNAVCDLTAGNYSLTLYGSGDEVASLNIPLQPPNSQYILSVPQAGAAGTAFTFYYCGYTAGTDVAIDFHYLATDSEGALQWWKSSEWTVRINDSGWAMNTLSSAPGDPARRYMLRDRERGLAGWDEIWLLP